MTDRTVHGGPIAAVTRVVDVTSEDPDVNVDVLPWRLAPPPGGVHIQLRTTVHRVAMGAGLSRQAALVAAVRTIPGIPGLMTSSSGGTFIMGGPGWLGISAIGVPPAGRALPLDWMVSALSEWFAAALRPLGVIPDVGCVTDAWCSGFSDIGVSGRKLAGMGFRTTRDGVAMRGVLLVTPITAGDLGLLAACHELISKSVRRDRITSVVEASGDPSWTTERFIEHCSGVVTPSS